MTLEMFVERHLIAAVATPPPSLAIAHLVHRDPIDPGPESRVAAKSMNRAEDAQKDFLREVERFVAVSKQAGRETQDHPVMLSHQLRARVLISGRAAPHEQGFSSGDLRPADGAGVLHREVSSHCWVTLEI
jgi:hypothetical protein